MEIYKSSLQFREIDVLSAAMESNPVYFPCKFRAIFVDFGGSSSTASDLSISIESRMRKLAKKDSISCGGCSYNSSVSVVLESSSGCFHSDNGLKWECRALNELSKYKDSGEYDDELFDEYLHSLFGDDGSHSNDGNVYTMVIVGTGEKEDVRAVVGKYRHAWIVDRISQEEAVKRVAEIFLKVFVNGGKDKGSISVEFTPVGADGRTVLSFNLLNSDPKDWTYDWYGTCKMSLLSEAEKLSTVCTLQFLIPRTAHHDRMYCLGDLVFTAAGVVYH